MPGARTTRYASLLIALGLVLVLVVVYIRAPQILVAGEQSLYDQQFRLRGPRLGNPQVMIVAIDEKSLKELGRWPWPRHVLADLVTRLDQAGAAVVAFDIILSEPERSGELVAAERLRKRLPKRGTPPAVRQEIETIAEEADHDARLAKAIGTSKRVILASMYAFAERPPAQAPVREGQPGKSAISRFKGYDQRGLFPPLNTVGATPPIPALADAAQALGHVNMIADFDGVTRWEALVVEHRGHYYPSLALEAVRVAAGLDPFALQLDFGSTVALGDVRIATDLQSRVLIDYAGPAKSFAHIPAADVLAGRVAPGTLRDRIVFIGGTAEATYDLRVTPFSPVMPGVEKHANMAANILDSRFLIRPGWIEMLELATILVFPPALAWLLPRLRPVMSLAAVLGIGLAYFAVTHVAFRRGVWLPVIYPTLAIALTFVGVTVYRFFTEERERLWTKRAFQQYVSPEVVERIVADPAALQFGGETRTLTILFCDIRDFTGFAERHGPQQVVAQLREHLTRLTNCVLEERGTLDKYIGDAIMAIFGAPIAQPDHAERACRAALRMCAEAERLRAKWDTEGKEGFRIGVGINTGDVVVGNLGSEQVFSYTVTGDAVNLGARLEALNKDYRTAQPILISEYTYEAARDAIEARPLGEVLVKGKSRPVAVYELLGLKSPAPAATPAAVTA